VGGRWAQERRIVGKIRLEGVDEGFGLLCPRRSRTVCVGDWERPFKRRVSIDHCD
jgi:hypothetical protein